MMEYEKLKKIGVFIIIILVIVVLGMVAINQTLGFFYKSQFLQEPCALCVSLNPEWSRCYDIISEEMKNTPNTNTIQFNLSDLRIK